MSWPAEGPVEWPQLYLIAGLTVFVVGTAVTCSVLVTYWLCRRFNEMSERLARLEERGK